MRANKQSVLILRIKSQRPNAEARQTMFARINTHPRRTSIVRSVDTASPLSVLIVLISITDKKFIRITRIDQNAGEISEGQITTASRPVITAIMRQKEGLFGSRIDERRALGILNNDIYW